ncbi:Alpha-tubulin suppressor [Geosporobacter subterraneus DSM 17957]|uniref:Alpha-tubulin suppressor n=1 Tax=Geosporobacter subterraneus DSM 17957 TaxID=1121919 RepID=A0A1M6CZ83_9FIRM|nr:S-layer homology domain-containing protein [Geosporobacter subterraneus]SHI66279.1 Alpha-tubulin suppressor [Geosporobacter subterraneus DSM 17957]
MVGKGKGIKIMAYIMLCSIFLNLFSSLMPVQVVFADEFEGAETIIEMNQEEEGHFQESFLEETEERLGDNADLLDVFLDEGVLNPSFNSNITEYQVEVDYDVTSVEIRAVLADQKAILEINGTYQDSGVARNIALNVGYNIISIHIIAENGIVEKIYTIEIERAEPVILNQMASMEGSADEVLQVAAGNNHSLGLKGDGTVWAWGNNENGRLGNGTTAQSETPVQVSDLTEVIAIAAGNGHSIALKADGTVWTWGKNDKGQLGDGTTTQKTTPVQVSGLTNIKAIAAGHNHSIALKADGTVWAWGNNEKGQLGDNSTSQRNTPVQVRKGVTVSEDAFLQGVIAIAAGKDHSVALREDEKVYTWGNGGNGILGNGSTSSSNTPVQVNTLTEVISISAQGEHTMALRRNGSLWTWGKNDKGQLGDGSTTNRTAPVQVSGLTNIVKIAAGNNFSSVLKTDGTVWTWGNNEKGQLGDGTTAQKNTPVQVLKGNSESTDQFLQEIVDISAGNNYVLAVKSNQTVWAWGDNGNGRLGDGTTTQQNTPVMNLLMDNGGSLPELPEWILEDDVEIESTYQMSEALSSFVTSLEFALLENITDLLDPKYITQPPAEEPQSPGQQPENPVEEPQNPGEQPQNPGNSTEKEDSSNSKDNAPKNSSKQNHLVEIINDKNEFRGQIDPQALKEAVARMMDKAAVEVEIVKINGKALLTLGADSLKILMENKASLIIHTEETSYVIPHNLSTLNKLSAEKGDIQALNIIMEKAALPPSSTEGHKILTNPVRFHVEAVFARETIELKHFGNQYIERRIVLNGTVDPRRAVGAVWENNDWKPVPTTFLQENGKTVAVIKRNGNSIYTVIEHDKTFEDISSHWAKSNIELLASKKVVKGMEENKFLPNSNVTRAQFVTMLMGSLGYKDDDSIIKPFKDVQTGSWYEKNVYAAMKLGIVTGYADGTFKPNKEITREEMAVMIAKTIEVLKGLDRPTTSSRIADRDQISPWAQIPAEAAIDLGIMKGYADQSFKPQNRATRAEAVTVFKNMMEHLEFIAQ